MKLSTKLSLALGTLTLCILIVGAIGIIQMNSINRTSMVLARDWLPAIVLVEEMNTTYSDYRIYQVQHVFADDDATMQGYEEKLRDIRTSFAQKMKKYEEFSMADEEKKVYAEFRQTRDQYNTLHDKFIALSRQNKREESIAMLNGEGLRLYNRLNVLLLKIVDINVQGGIQASEEGDVMYREARTTIFVILGIAILLAIAIAAYIIRDTLKQLGKDPGELGAIAKSVAAGNLDMGEDKAAIGVYADIRVMVENLKVHIQNAQQESTRAKQESEKAQEAMQRAEVASKDAQNKQNSMLQAADRLEEVAGIVSSASAELSAQIEQSERGAAEQANRVTETATAMEEMNSTVIEVARNAGTAADVSTQTRQKAEDGARIVQEAVQSIQGVQNSSLALKEDMAALSEKAQGISQIMGVISDIADQTNLLALNAAIEAARAGDAGRGFAVVADEVRKLAEKTMTSTTDVGKAIRDIQDSAAKSVAQVEETVRNIEQATSLAGRSGEALHEIVGMVDGTADQVRAIATASEQQSASSEEINRSMVQVNSIASETARAMEEAAKAVSDLASQAQVLTHLIDQMKAG